MRELGEHEPVLRGALHPGADVGHERARGPDAVVAAPQRAERARRRALMTLRRVAAVEAAELPREKEADQQRAEAERRDVARVPQFEFTDAADEEIADDDIEEAPQFDRRPEARGAAPQSAGRAVTAVSVPGATGDRLRAGVRGRHSSRHHSLRGARRPDRGRNSGRTHGNVAFALFYGLFVIAVAIHAPIGLRNILREWTAWRGRSLDLALALFSILLLVLGMRAVFAVYTA